MSFSVLNPARARLLALLLVAMFSFTAIGATTIASATATSSAKKKCKKGYKRVGKKCKKKKAASSAVVAVNLYMAEPRGATFRVYGEVLTKSGFVGSKTVTYTIVSAAGTQTVTGKATGHGGRTEVNFTQDMTLTFTDGQPVQITAKVETKVSNTLTVRPANPTS